MITLSYFNSLELDTEESINKVEEYIRTCNFIQLPSKFSLYDDVSLLEKLVCKIPLSIYILTRDANPNMNALIDHLYSIAHQSWMTLSNCENVKYLRKFTQTVDDFKFMCDHFIYSMHRKFYNTSHRFNCYFENKERSYRFILDTHRNKKLDIGIIKKILIKYPQLIPEIQLFLKIYYEKCIIQFLDANRKTHRLIYRNYHTIDVIAQCNIGLHFARGF